MDQGSSVPLGHVAAFDWPSLLLQSPLPRLAATVVIDGEGETFELNVTRRLTAGAAWQCGRSRPSARASMGDLVQVTSLRVVILIR